MYFPSGKDFLHFTHQILNGIPNPQTLVLFQNHVLTSSIFGNLTLNSEKFNFECKHDFYVKLKQQTFRTKIDEEGEIYRESRQDSSFFSK